MMQEVGKVKITCGRILSIQSQLGGLSFYCRRDKKYSFRQIRDIADIAPVITKELFGEDYDEVNFYHNSLDYIIIPRELFDENMCDAYLLSKGIVQSDNKVISVTLTDSLAYVSMIERDILVDNIIVNVFPIVAKTFLFCSNYDCDIISYVIVDNILHISYGEGHMIKFCDSLPLVSVNDFEFFCR